MKVLEKNTFYAYNNGDFVSLFVQFAEFIVATEGVYDINPALFDKITNAIDEIITYNKSDKKSSRRNEFKDLADELYYGGCKIKTLLNYVIATLKDSKVSSDKTKIANAEKVVKLISETKLVQRTISVVSRLSAAKQVDSKLKTVVNYHADLKDLCKTFDEKTTTLGKAVDDKAEESSNYTTGLVPSKRQEIVQAYNMLVSHLDVAVQSNNKSAIAFVEKFSVAIANQNTIIKSRKTRNKTGKSTSEEEE